MAIVSGGRVSPERIVEAARAVGTPLYVYDEAMIAQRAKSVLAMPTAFGLSARYAMKANPSRAILELVTREGLGLDASSLNEVRRARLAGVACDRMMLTIHEQFPQYNFARHKGYGTPEHLAALGQYGPSPVHRKSFAPVRQAIEPVQAEFSV